ncbi:MAG: S49 family peptidase [Nitrososphaerota archaeon]|nr:S49 family peptidase [Candidatus Bathyarchaeota archaeon]MDW8024127.1 S49 family peptidase [Nitrososphaerota archaeon]
MRLKPSEKLIAIILVALLAYFGIGYLYLSFTLLRKPPRVENIVGIVRIDGYIVSSEVARECISIIHRAAANESIKAVVLVVDSRGGYADYVEQIYLDLLELKEKKVLVASIITALSGGYYIAVAADYIFAHPTSFVGNVGVVGTGPPVLVPSEYVLETGPFKATGFSALLFPYNLSRALENFASAVEAGRGERLKLTSKELRMGLIYLGVEALNVGLVDEIGSIQKAIDKAAERAGLKEYEVVELRPQGNSHGFLQTNHNYTYAESITLETLNKLHTPPAIHFIYLSPFAITQSSTTMVFSNTPASAGGDVLVDVSHGNIVSWWHLDILIAELAKRNVTTGFISSWKDIESRLDGATCLIIASPTEAYSMEECEKIRSFVDKGGILLLFFDPAWEYVGGQGLHQGIIGPINSLSHIFGLTFAKGYVYNEYENFGMYRNIYVKNFANSPLTQNLSKLVFFTATHIYSMNTGVAWSSEYTYSSVGEKAGNYTLIALANRGNGTVAAFGDLTFLSEPWCYVEDNYQVILNLVSLITEAKSRVPPKVSKVEGKITRPELPVGTKKIYTQWVDGERSTVSWLKVSEEEVLIERLNITYHYYYVNGSLTGWSANNMSATYEIPIPEAPYPLTGGKRWGHETGYILKIDGEEVQGYLLTEEEVVGFEEVASEEGIKYFCAKVKYRTVDRFTMNETKVTVISTGYYWVSSQVGDVKDDVVAITYIDSTPYKVEMRKMLLRSVHMGG